MDGTAQMGKITALYARTEEAKRKRGEGMSFWEQNGKSDEWYTPPEIFDGLGCIFDTDVASPEDRTYVYTPATKFITADSLSSEWIGFCWMNPPFGGRNGILPWLEKMADHGNGIALTPDRTSAEWWQYGASRADAMLFVKGKIKFIRQDGTRGKSPSTGTTLFAYGEHARHILIKAQSLGITTQRAK